MYLARITDEEAGVGDYYDELALVGENGTLLVLSGPARGDCYHPEDAPEIPIPDHDEIDLSLREAVVQFKPWITNTSSNQ